VRLFNARDGEWQATIQSLHKRGHGQFAVAARLRPPEREDGPVLLFAPVKRDATDLVARMATELGVSALWPVLTERTNTARINTHRLSVIAVEAAEQCERLSVPLVAEPRRLGQVLSEWQPERTLYAAVERLAGAPRSERDSASPDRGPAPGPAALLIGPEGGFTSLELDALRARPFVTLISLGSRILRAETAATAGLACLQAARERWGLVPDGTAPG
jgi:16S rRNA (uracil1498-N3)-methyltransferase